MTRKKSLGSLALEVFSIVLGVLLALAVSEWQEEREKDERATAALYNVKQELLANVEILQLIHDNNQATIDAALAQEEGDDESRRFIPGLQVRATAWETLLATGVSTHIDYELLLALSETYSMQGIYRQTGMQLVEASMNMAAMATVKGTEIDNENLQAQFMNFFNMFLLMEESLLDSYQASLERL